jgi:hypothetical protein
MTMWRYYRNTEGRCKETNATENASPTETQEDVGYLHRKIKGKLKRKLHFASYLTGNEQFADKYCRS